MSVVHQLVSPVRVTVPVALHDVVREVHAGFVIKSLPGSAIKFTAEESSLSSNLSSSFTSVLDLKSRAEESKVRSEAEVPLEKSIVNCKSGEEDVLATSEVPSKVSSVGVLVEVGSVFVELFLRVDVLHSAGSGPPFRAGLHENVVGLQFLDELLGALGEHCRLVQSSHKVDILSIESLSQMDECCVEAVVSVSNSVVDVRMQVLSSQESVSGER